MARPKKQGLDYFPLDVSLFSDKKIKIVKARYGADGIALYLYLLCEIYKNGYYLPVDEDFLYIASADLGMSREKIGQILNFLLKRSLFDNTLFQSDKVLTSRSIQRRFQNAVKERAKKNPIEAGDFWLLKENETESFIKVCHFLNKSENNIGFSGNNPSFSQEKSLKESKVNYTSIEVWKKNNSGKNGNTKPPNRFNDFPQRNYETDRMETLEQQLLRRQDAITSWHT